MRKIIVDGVEWSFVIGKSNLAVRRIGSNEKHVVHPGRVLGLDPEAWERGHCKRSTIVNVPPVMIAEFIRNPKFFQTASMREISAAQLKPQRKPGRLHALYCESYGGYPCSCR